MCGLCGAPGVPNPNLAGAWLSLLAEAASGTVGIRIAQVQPVAPHFAFRQAHALEVIL